MSQPTFTIEYTEPRSRLTNFFRYILVIPHIIVCGVWQYLAQILAFFQWWVILFTGKRNQSLWTMQNNWLGYAARVYSYYGLMYDKWPNIGVEPNGEPTSYHFEYQAEANRLTNFFRVLWLIPTAIVAIFVMIGALVTTVLCWLAIIFTGKQPRGMFDFLAKVHGFMVRVWACSLMMSDVRPKFGA
jgi:Domain of unknown function (DUF4389)